MRVGLVLSSVPPYSETFFRSKINGLTSAGAEIILFARGRKTKDITCRVVRPYPILRLTALNLILVPVVCLWTFVRARGPALTLWKMERDIGFSRLEVAKIIYRNAHMLPYSLDWLHFGFATATLGSENVAASIGAKMGVSLRGFDINVYPLKNKDCYRLMWQRVNRVHVLSEYLAGKAREFGMPDSMEVHIITPAVARQVLDMDAKQWFNTKVQILTIARLHWIKGLDYALDAMSILKHSGLQFTYEIIGDGVDEERLLFAINQLNIANEVKLIGKQTHEQTISRLAACDLYLQPSVMEGFCNAVLEAQSVGRLCVVTDAGALRENVIHGQTGWVVPARNARAIASEIQKVIKLPATEKQMISRQARQRVAQHFALDQQIAKWMRFYTSTKPTERAF